MLHAHSVVRSPTGSFILHTLLFLTAFFFFFFSFIKAFYCPCTFLLRLLSAPPSPTLTGTSSITTVGGSGGSLALGPSGSSSGGRQRLGSQTEADKGEGRDGVPLSCSIDSHIHTHTHTPPTAHTHPSLCKQAATQVSPLLGWDYPQTLLFFSVFLFFNRGEGMMIVWFCC